MIVPSPAGGRWYAVPKGERVLKVLKFDAPSARGVVAASPQILKNAFLSSLLLAHPHSGVDGERSEPITSMRIMPYDL